METGFATVEDGTGTVSKFLVAVAVVVMEAVRGGGGGVDDFVRCSS